MLNDASIQPCNVNTKETIDMTSVAATASSGNYLLEGIQGDNRLDVSTVRYTYNISAERLSDVNAWWSDNFVGAIISHQSFPSSFYEHVFQSIAHVVNLNFIETQSSDTADLLLAIGTNWDVGVHGAGIIAQQYGNTESWVMIEENESPTSPSFIGLLTHEILHSLGLAHPHDDG